LTQAAHTATRIRKPRVSDAIGIKILVDSGADAGALLPRTLAEICERIREFHIYEDDKGVGGCCALHIDLVNLAEVRTLLVRPDLQGRGIGRELLYAVIDEARELGIHHVYALTREIAFFQKHGFYLIDKSELPNKVFRDCVKCPSFPQCDEEAVMFDIYNDVKRVRPRNAANEA
jgi:amino-acid N-acetyltransferase